MKKKIILILLIIFENIVLGQVGIGTSSPISSSILDVTSSNKGVLIPRVELTSVNDKSPLEEGLPNGTMIFNTIKAGTGQDTVIPGVYIWADNKWNFPAELGIMKPRAVKFSNSPSSTTNFNPATTSLPVNIDIFSNEIFNDDTTLFEKIDNYQLRIKQKGLYFVSVNLALKQNPTVNESRLSDYIYLNIDGNLASAKLITLVPQYNPSNININGRFAFGSNSYINATANSILTFHSQRYKDGSNYNGTVNFDNVSLSSITIIKIQ